METILVKKLNADAQLPKQGTEGAAGWDLYANLGEGYCMTIKPGETKMIGTGLAMAIPQGYWGGIYARSGLACKNDLAPANKVGVIDSDYRGEIIVALHNHSETATRIINHNDKIAQFVLQKINPFEFVEKDELPDTTRGAGGFGSTGK